MAPAMKVKELAANTAGVIMCIAMCIYALFLITHEDQFRLHPKSLDTKGSNQDARKTREVISQIEQQETEAQGIPLNAKNSPPQEKGVNDIQNGQEQAQNNAETNANAASQNTNVQQEKMQKPQESKIVIKTEENTQR